MEHPSKLLKRIGIPPLKSFGQNFLLHTNSLTGAEKEIIPEEKILEIGPGLGAVTEFFLTRGYSMILCEKDRSLAAFLREKYSNEIQNGKLEVMESDFLKMDISVWEKANVTQAVGNLPFYITAPILTRVAGKMPFVNRFLFGIQKDVADKITVPKGNSLALYLHSLGDAKVFAPMKKGNFYPVPKVDASWVVWTRNHKVEKIEQFEIILRSAFWGKRKSLQNSLLKNPFIQAEGLEQIRERFQSRLKEVEDDTIKILLTKRADQLEFADYLKLYHYLVD
ncbi:MAG: rRNA adenine dimethyltransferase family protein [Leptospirales bacterium]